MASYPIKRQRLILIIACCTINNFIRFQRMQHAIDSLFNESIVDGEGSTMDQRGINVDVNQIIQIMDQMFQSYPRF